jgi:hypothetical protein
MKMTTTTTTTTTTIPFQRMVSLLLLHNFDPFFWFVSFKPSTLITAHTLIVDASHGGNQTTTKKEFLPFKIYVSLAVIDPLRGATNGSRPSPAQHMTKKSVLYIKMVNSAAALMTLWRRASVLHQGKALLKRTLTCSISHDLSYSNNGRYYPYLGKATVATTDCWARRFFHRPPYR